MRKMYLIASVILITISFIVASTMAKTPDENTPIEETVCDDAGLYGKAWGLCNAYCEAIDCDSDNPHATDKACDKLFDDIVSLTGEAPPCEVQCPCWTAESIDAHARALPESPLCVAEIDFDIVVLQSGCGCSGHDDVIYSASVRPALDGPGMICSLHDEEAGIDTGSIVITADEASLCTEILINSSMWSFNCTE